MMRITLAAALMVPLIAGCAAEQAAPAADAAGAAEPAAPVAAQGPAEGSVVSEAEIPPDVQKDSWARLPLLTREKLDADGQRAWDVLVNPESRYATGPRGPVAMWLYSPMMAEHIFPASTYLRFGTDKDQRLTELTILATAREVKSQYEWTAHEPAGQRAGLEDAIIDIVKHRRSLDEAGDVPGLGDKERTIIRFVREVISEPKLSAETYAKAIALVGEKGVMDLAGLVGYYSFVNITLKTFDVNLEPGRTRLLPPLW